MSATSPHDAERSPHLRILLLALTFPRPQRQIFPWGLSLARALEGAGHQVRTVCFLPLLPRWWRWPRHYRGTADCPATYAWGALRADYPRWPIYQTRRRRLFPPTALEGPLAWWWGRRTLRRIVREYQPDAVLVFNTFPMGYLALRLKQECGLPYVVSIHSLNEASNVSVPRLRRTTERIYEQASSVVVLSQRMRGDLNSAFPRIQPKVIYNGVPGPPTAAPTAPRPADLEGKIVVFSAGAFRRPKAFPSLIRALARVAGDRPQVVLRIAGCGEEEAAIKAEIDKTGLGGRVTLLGMVAHETLMREMVGCDLFALPAWEDAFATVFLEAAACGKPSLWCTDGGINEVLKDSVHGRAIPPRDEAALVQALAELLSDPGRLRWMGQAARGLYEQTLSDTAYGRRMTALLEQARIERA